MATKETPEIEPSKDICFTITSFGGGGLSIENVLYDKLKIDIGENEFLCIKEISS